MFSHQTYSTLNLKRKNALLFSCRDTAQDVGFRPCQGEKPLDLDRPPISREV